MGDGVADLDFLRRFDARDDVAHITCRQHILRHLLQLKHTDFVSMVFLACGKELHEVVGTQGTIHDTEIGNDTTERIEHRVKNQSL